MNPKAGASPAVEGARPRLPEKSFEVKSKGKCPYSAGQDARLCGRPEARRYAGSHEMHARHTSCPLDFLIEWEKFPGFVSTVSTEMSSPARVSLR